MHVRNIVALAALLFGLHNSNAQLPEQPGPNNLLIAALTGSASDHGILQSSAEDIQDISGEWDGTFSVLGQKLRLTLHIRRNPEGKLTGTLDSPDQGASDIPISRVEQTGGDVELELSGIAAAYHGKVNASGNEIIGAWKQNGGILPVVFTRSIEKAPADPRPSKGLPATLAGFEDQANFILFLNGQRLTVMQSTWRKNGSFEGHAAMNLAGQKTETTTRILPARDGRWARITMESALGLVMLTRKGSTVTHMFKVKKNTWESREGMVLFDNNSPALISQALRRYDRRKGGVQKFPVLILPDTLAELRLEAMKTTHDKIGGKKWTLTKFFYGLPGIDIHVWADTEGRVYLVDIPAQKATFVREGYEALRKPEISDLSQSPLRKTRHDQAGQIKPVPCCQ